MMRLTLLSIVVLAAISTLVTAQSKPNFTGTWNCDKSRTSNGCTSDAIIIKHSGDTMTVQRTEPNAVVQTFKLDGTETTNVPLQKLGFGGNPLPQSKSVARWDGTTLIIESRTIQEPPRVTKSVWRLSADGKEFVIEADRSGPGAPPNSKVTWVKAGA